MERARSIEGLILLFFFPRFNQVCITTYLCYCLIICVLLHILMYHCQTVSSYGHTLCSLFINICSKFKSISFMHCTDHLSIKRWPPNSPCDKCNMLYPFLLLRKRVSLSFFFVISIRSMPPLPCNGLTFLNEKPTYITPSLTLCTSVWILFQRRFKNM